MASQEDAAVMAADQDLVDRVDIITDHRTMDHTTTIIITMDRIITIMVQDHIEEAVDADLLRHL